MTTLSKKIISAAISKKIRRREEFFTLARQIASAQNTTIPPISELRQTYLNSTSKGQKRQDDALNRILCKRNVRTLSGVAIITVLTKPWPCPGKCIYCPTEARMPKSYLSNEPAASRALRLKFDPYRQVMERIKTLEANGHPTDKIELIVKGGTWSSYPWRYQQWFISECFRASNESLKCHREERAGRATWRSRTSTGLLRSPQSLAMTLNKVQKKNETAPHRIIGLTLETRPDWITPEEILRLRQLGCTRVELGVQATDDKILKKIKRGHNLAQVKSATKLLKDAGFKVDYHLMPMLPGTSPSKDLKMFARIFSDPDLRPDMIKIYPCTVIKNSPLYTQWRQGKYKPYSDKQLIEMLIKAKSTLIPYYCRISRLIRDIPSTSIEAGNRITNLREIIQREMAKRGLKCKCLRCREVGHQNPPQSPFYKGGSKGDLQIFIDKYQASGGTEYFLSIENPRRKVVYAFCRLRIPSNVIARSLPAGRRRGDPEQQRDCFPRQSGVAMTELQNAALLRELHTYGHLMPIIENPSYPPLIRGGTIQNFPPVKGELKGVLNEIQHTGLGKQLIQKAEQIAKQRGYKKMAVISGVGVREYYRKLGYRLENTYMVKWL